MIRFLLHTSDHVLAQALIPVLKRSGGFEILPCCSSVERLARDLLQCPPDVALLDLSSELTFALLARMKRESPAKLVLWVSTISQELAFHAMESGVRGILRKSLPAALHIKCLRTVQEGGSWFERSLIRESACPPAPALLPQERTLLRLLAQGMKNHEIAAATQLPETQVKDSLSRLFRKIGVRDRFELALYGLKHVPMKSTTADQEDGAKAAHGLQAIA
jgi:DNA-binding NarL/FixJ family response regulator